jgi:hypothetical protein
MHLVELATPAAKVADLMGIESKCGFASEGVAGVAYGVVY